MILADGTETLQFSYALTIAVITGVLAIAGAIVAGAFALRSKGMERQLSALQLAAARDIRVELDLPQELINQYQEMTQELREEVAGLRSEVKAFKTRIECVESKSDAYRNFAWRLIDHINNGLGPPPPAWPAEIQ